VTTGSLGTAHSCHRSKLHLLSSAAEFIIIIFAYRSGDLPRRGTYQNGKEGNSAA
jgi:hypothetical protein